MRVIPAVQDGDGGRSRIPEGNAVAAVCRCRQAGLRTWRLSVKAIRSVERFVMSGCLRDGLGSPPPTTGPPKPHTLCAERVIFCGYECGHLGAVSRVGPASPAAALTRASERVCKPRPATGRNPLRRFATLALSFHRALGTGLRA